MKLNPIFTNSPWIQLESLLQKKLYSNYFIVVDENTEIHCLSIVIQHIKDYNSKLIKIPQGESNKSIQTCNLLWNELIEKGVDRNSVILALGGGVLCDLVGFCSATMLRGIDFFYIPTTLMAMVDASIGGKCGVNFLHFKNQIGVFTLPIAIVIDPIFLKTLSQRHLKNGIVEMLKHTLLKETNLDAQILNRSLHCNLDQIIESIDFKKSIVEKDFKETKLRKILNFGHTIGHAIETYSLKHGRDYLHGECVAVGMICELYISAALYNWDKAILYEICDFIRPFTNQFKISEFDFATIIEYLKIDKKTQFGTPSFSLLEQMGKPVTEIKVSEALIVKSLEFYSN